MNGPRARRGGVAMMAAAAAVPLLVAVGLAVDLSRLYVLNSRLVSATDAAVLAGARALSDTKAVRDDQVHTWFWANFGRRNGTVANPAANQVGYLDSTVLPLVIESDGLVLRVRATAQLPTTFMGLATLLPGVSGQFATMTTHADQSARRQDRSMELALVLDVTGSMAYSAGLNQGSKIAAMRDAATLLVNNLFGSTPTFPNSSRVSVVPYSATVNIGRSRPGWLDQRYYRPSDFSPTVWRGCVEARRNGEDTTDTPPTLAEGLFRPFLWTSTVGRYSPWPGDNEWSASRVTEVNPETPGTDSTHRRNRGFDEVGPNVDCERALTPLTDSRATVLREIAALRSAPERGGTISNHGLQWGWATLSPRWQGLWGTADQPVPATSPLAYNTRGVDKVLILMTDGINELLDFDRGAPGRCSSSYCSNYPARPPVNSDYTSYGRMAENRLGVGTVSNASYVTEFNRRTALLCERIKQPEPGTEKDRITIYTITFDLDDTATQQLFRNCASKPEYYFNSPDAAALRAAFREIAGQLANLRLTQ